MRFLVPQFIEVEDQIIGPLTLKQGLYMLGGIGFCVLLYLRFGFFITLLLGGPVGALAFLLAFVKIQGRPFSHILASAFFFFTKEKLYLWKKKDKKTEQKSKEGEGVNKKQTGEPLRTQFTHSNLKKLAWFLDTSNEFEKK